MHFIFWLSTDIKITHIRIWPRYRCSLCMLLWEASVETAVILLWCELVPCSAEDMFYLFNSSEESSKTHSTYHCELHPKAMWGLLFQQHTLYQIAVHKIGFSKEHSSLNVIVNNLIYMCLVLIHLISICVNVLSFTIYRVL
jgi:hypothetical protein